MSKILITGATGNLGSGVVDSLLQKTDKENIIALARDMEKAETLKNHGIEVRKGDYDEYPSLVEAFQGIDKLYFVSGSDVTKRMKQHENIVNAAAEAGVEHVIYTSFIRENETESSPIWSVAQSHLQTEEWLKESGMDYTILKHNLYLDFLPMFLGEDVVEEGSIYLPAGNGKTAFTLRKEMAEAASVILTSNGHEGKEYDITNEEAWSFSEIAEQLSEITNKEITYISPEPEEFISTLKEAGVPEEGIQVSAGFAGGIREGEFNRTSRTIRDLTGSEPLPVPVFLREVYGS